MRKIKEVLRLRFELGLGQRQIARSCGIGLSTVHDYLERAGAAGIAGRCARRSVSAANLPTFQPSNLYTNTFVMNGKLA